MSDTIDSNDARIAAIREAYQKPELLQKISRVQRQIWEDLDPEERERRADVVRRACARPKEVRSAGMKEAWANLDPAERERRIAEIKQRNAAKKGQPSRTSAAIAKRSWADPEIRARRIAAIRAANAKPEVRQRKIEAQQRVREQKSESIRQSWRDPKVKARRARGIKRAVNAPEVVEKKSVSMKGVWARRNAELAAAKRPDDWWDHDKGDWRIVATELLSKDYMSNKELGRRLDKRRLIQCPYGESWETALTDDKNAITFVMRIRKWIGRPGRTQKPLSIHI